MVAVEWIAFDVRGPPLPVGKQGFIKRQVGGPLLATTHNLT